MYGRHGWIYLEAHFNTNLIMREYRIKIDNLKVDFGVFIHDKKYLGKEKYLAYFYSDSNEFHFTKRSFVPKIIAHESAHAALYYTKDLEIIGKSSEEFFCEIIEQLVEKISAININDK